MFDGEEGVDMGGVKKEFYAVISKQLLDPAYGMFKYIDADSSGSSSSGGGGYYIWFNGDSLPESDPVYELIGEECY
jgi:E3 ubiquitin-protein ligase HERC4